jgi:DNA-binding response OmpR family regulator
MRVLLVEDDEALAAATKRGLVAESFDVDVRHDGDSGLELALRGGYDAIVLDLLLPGRNGWTVCRDLRSAGLATPVLILTAKTGADDEVELLDAGADDYLRKPFSYIVLAARLRAIARRTRPDRRPLLCVGPLEFDPATRALRRGDEPIGLTRREARLLEVLLRHDGAVVPKSDLLDCRLGPRLRRRSKRRRGLYRLPAPKD